MQREKTSAFEPAVRRQTWCLILWAWCKILPWSSSTWMCAKSSWLSLVAPGGYPLELLNLANSTQQNQLGHNVAMVSCRMLKLSARLKWSCGPPLSGAKLFCLGMVCVTTLGYVVHLSRPSKYVALPRTILEFVLPRAFQT